MRIAISYASIFSASMLAACSTFAASNYPNNPPSPKAKVIYGLSNTKHVNSATKGQYYVQAGTFKDVKNAKIYKKQLTRKFHKPVTVESRGKYFVVIIGPITSVEEVRALSGRSTATSPIKKVALKSDAPSPVIRPEAQIKSQVIIGDKDGLEPIALNHFEIIGAAGIASLNAGDGYLGVTSSETDKLVQTNKNNWDTFGAQLGAGYVDYFRHYNPYSDQYQWFTAIEPEINGYYLGQNSIKGDVWRFGSPNFNDMTFEMPIESYRLMFVLL